MYAVIKCDHKYTQCRIQFPVIQYDWGVKWRRQSYKEVGGGINWNDASGCDEWKSDKVLSRLPSASMCMPCELARVTTCSEKTDTDMLKQECQARIELEFEDAVNCWIWSLGSNYELGVKGASECSKLMENVLILVRKVWKWIVATRQVHWQKCH
jgi:hypothetical protein